MTDHPITPPPELVQQWASESLATQNLCTRAAQWGADQELEACIDVLSGQWQWDTLFECTEWKEFRDKSKNILRAARRPNPSSLKKQALETLEDAPGPDYPRSMTVLNADQHALIRKALEALPE